MNNADLQFLVCPHCGNIVAKVNDSGVPIVCCGENMKELIPNSKDAAGEKHVPVCEVKGNIVTVKVGEIAHPMVEEHYIQWIAIHTKEGNQRKILSPGDEPKAVFSLVEGDELVAAYEYCNLHGLWRS